MGEAYQAISEAELNAEAIKFGQHYIKTQLPEGTDLVTKTQALNHAVRSFFAGVRWLEKEKNLVGSYLE